MSAILTSLRNTVIAGIALAVVLFIIYYVQWGYYGSDFGVFFFRWLHVISGVMWIGLLWYFNFVQIPTMPAIPDDLKPAIGKHIGPAALWWFRWAAMSTIVTGLIVAAMYKYLGYVAGGFLMTTGLIIWTEGTMRPRAILTVVIVLGFLILLLDILLHNIQLPPNADF